MDLKEEDILGKDIENHWYYRAKSEAMLQYLHPLEIQKILDVGAGSGFFSKYLLTHTAATDAVCVDPYYSEEKVDTLANGKPMHFRKTCESVDSNLVLMMDVLEHVDDDVALIKEYLSRVNSTTHFLITVPAFSWLWSEHDVFLGHVRRYTLDQLQDTVTKAGLHIEKCNYFFGFVFPLAASVRLAKAWLGRKNSSPSSSDLKRHHPVTNQVLYTVCRLEIGLQNYNRLAGLSVFCLARY